MRNLVVVLLFLSLALVLLSCVSPPPAAFHISRAGWKGEGHRVLVLPGSVKIREMEVPRAGFHEQVEIHAARGEAESRQILVLAGSAGIEGARAHAEPLEGPDGSRIPLELGLVEYTNVRKPGLRSFGVRGRFPDPIVPETAFTLAPGKNRIVYLSVRVPREALPGTYTGALIISINTDSPLRVPISLTVHPVTLPVKSALRSSVYWRLEYMKEERYYGEAWTTEHEEALIDLGLEYRFSARPEIPWVEAARSGDWSTFDEVITHWMAKGLTGFELRMPFPLGTSAATIESDYAPLLEKVNAHVVERGWADQFYIYFFDEPKASILGELAEKLAAMRRAAPAIKQLHTYGVTMAGERKLKGLAGIWVPNIHQFDESFARERQAAGDEYWIYTCIGNIHRRYPDNFRLDWYGASHRALGWWLFMNRIDGYLYWGADYWRFNPWETAETFPWANGDGSMFYPDPEKRRLPFPSLRAHAMRDSFEDHDLLCLLRDRATRDEAFAADERVKALLAGGGLSDGHIRFDTDDNAYDERHRELLELLSQD